MADRVAFTEESARRVAKATRTVEGMPYEDQPGRMDNARPIPFQFRRFELKTEFSRVTTDGPLRATAYPRTYDASESDYVTDTEEEFYVYNSAEMDTGGTGKVEQAEYIDAHPGTYGIAYHPHDVTAGRWEVVAMDRSEVLFELTGTSDYVFKPGESHDALIRAWTGTGYDPHDSLDITVYDSSRFFTGSFSSSAGGTWGRARYHAASNRWEICAPSQDGYCKAQAHWVYASYCYVSCKVCDYDGSNERGSAFNVYLPRLAGNHPAVYKDDVIGYEVKEDGRLEGSKYACHTKIGHKIEGYWSAAQVPPGYQFLDGGTLHTDAKINTILGLSWTNVPDMQGRTSVCIDDASGAETDEDDLGETHGVNQNHRHAIDTSSWTNATVVTGVTGDGVATVTTRNDVMVNPGTNIWSSGADELSGEPSYDFRRPRMVFRHAIRVY